MSTDNDIIFGSTDYGFIPRQLKDIQIAINEDLALIVDERTQERPFQNATDDTILQQMVAIFAEAVSFVENAAHEAFYMRDPLTATKAGLSQLAQLNGIVRNPGSPTIIPMTLVGTPGTVVPQGSLIGSADGTTYYATNADVVIQLDGTVPVSATSTTDGPYDPDPGTVVTIITQIPGWTGATNGVTSSIGVEEETDEQLRRRQQLSTNATSYRQIEAIRAAVANVPGVTFVRAYQNATLTTDERGIPGKCLACVVVGGDNNLIARALVLRVPLGIGYWGNTFVVFYDELNVGITVRFSRPVERPVRVRVVLQIIVDENIQIFPAGGVQLIKDAILDFAANGSSACEPIGNPGFPPGQDIINSQLYTPINSIGGAKVVSLQLAFDGQPLLEQDLPIAWDEIGVFSADRIEVVFQ